MFSNLFNALDIGRRVQPSRAFLLHVMFHDRRSEDLNQRPRIFGLVRKVCAEVETRNRSKISPTVCRRRIEIWSNLVTWNMFSRFSLQTQCRECDAPLHCTRGLSSRLVRWVETRTPTARRAYRLEECEHVLLERDALLRSGLGRASVSARPVCNIKD